MEGAVRYQFTLAFQSGAYQSFYNPSQVAVCYHVAKPLSTGEKQSFNLWQRRCALVSADNFQQAKPENHHYNYEIPFFYTWPQRCAYDLLGRSGAIFFHGTHEPE